MSSPIRALEVAIRAILELLDNEETRNICGDLIQFAKRYGLQEGLNMAITAHKSIKEYVEYERQIRTAVPGVPLQRG